MSKSGTFDQVLPYKLANFLTQILQHISLNAGWISRWLAADRCSVGWLDYVPGLLQDCLCLAVAPELHTLRPGGKRNCRLAPKECPAPCCHASTASLATKLHLCRYHRPNVSCMAGGLQQTGAERSLGQSCLFWGVLCWGLSHRFNSQLAFETLGPITLRGPRLA